RVARAPLLEAARALQVVELAVDVRAGQLRQRDRFHAGRLVDRPANALACGLDIGERDHGVPGLRARMWAPQNGRVTQGLTASRRAPAYRPSSKPYQRSPKNV